VSVLPMDDGPRKKGRVPWGTIAGLELAVIVVMVLAYCLGIIPPMHSGTSQSRGAAPTASPRTGSKPAANTAFTKCTGIAAGSSTANVPLRATKMEIRFALKHNCWYRFDFEMRYEMPTQLPAASYWLPSEPVFNSEQLAILGFIQKLDHGLPAANQLHVIGIPDNVPGWANPGLGSQCNNGPVLCAPDAAHVAAYGQFAGDVAFALHEVTDNVAIEPGNEVNSAFSFEPDPSPAVYVAMLKSTTKYVNLLPKYAKFVHEKTQVIFSGLSPAQNPGISPLTHHIYGFIDPATFVADAYAAGARPYFTAMGMHVGMNGLSQVAAVYSVMRRYGDAAKPTVITEFDIVTDPTRVAPGTVGYVDSVKRQWMSLPWLKSVLVYAPPADGADNSLFTTGMQPKGAMLAAAAG
jgi:hypothetical protein